MMARARFATLALSLATACGFSFELEGRCFDGDPCSKPDSGPPPPDTKEQPEADTNPTGDDDDDGAPNATDTCREVWDPSQLDYDDDGQGDECDPCPFVAGGAAPCYTEWEGTQLEGEWSGYASLSPAPANLLDTK